MANTIIQLKHSTETGNVPSSLANGEISINSRDGKFFYSTPANVVVTHYPYSGPAGLNQEIQFNDSGVLGSDSGLTYNKTTDVLTVDGGAIIGGVNVSPQIQLAFTQANTPSHVANSAAIYANGAFTRANNSINANTGGTITGDLSVTGNLTVTGFTTYTNTSTVLIADNIITVNAAINQSAQPAVNAGIEVDRGAQPNSSFLWIETSGKWAANNGNGSIFIAAESAESYANSAFAAANAASATDTTQNNSITAALNTANAAFIAANAATATDTTQNNSITAAFTAANTPSHVANSAAIYANGAFTAANTAAVNALSAGTYANGAFAAANAATTTNVTQNNSITAAFTRANNSINANTGGTIVGDLSVTGNTVISGNSANAALRITQIGAGNALLVEDSANPDATPTVIDASGNVGIGTASPSALLHVSSGSAKIRIGLEASSQYLDIYRDSPTGFTIYNAAQADPYRAHIFQIAGTERARIATTGVISLGAAPGSESLRVTPVASAVNYYNITGGVTTGSPYIAAQGSDANIHSQYLSKGTYGHIFNTGSAGNFQFYVAHTASAVNYLQVTGAATAGAPVISAAGTDTNIGITLTPKGTGQVKFGTLIAATIPDVLALAIALG